MDDKRYEPRSEFLRALIGRSEALSDSQEDRAALACLIRMTRDRDPVNRDWAAMLLWQQEIDTPEVREALLAAAEDEHASVRAEAIRGLAQLAPDLALPFICRELMSDHASAPLFEAAAIVADPSLVDDLRAFAEPSGNDYLDGLAREALAACEAASKQQR